MNGEIVCHCMEVTRAQILEAIQKKGCKTFEEIQRETEAGTVCGGCEEEIQAILDEHARG